MLEDVGQQDRAERPIVGRQLIGGHDLDAARARDRGGRLVGFDPHTHQLGREIFQDATGTAAEVQHAAAARHGAQPAMQHAIGWKIGIDVEHRAIERRVVRIEPAGGQRHRLEVEAARGALAHGVRRLVEVAAIQFGVEPAGRIADLPRVGAVTGWTRRHGEPGLTHRH